MIADWNQLWLTVGDESFVSVPSGNPAVKIVLFALGSAVVVAILSIFLSNLLFGKRGK